MDKSKKTIIIAVFVIIGMMVGVTYSWYTWVSSNTDVTLTIGGITINYEAGNDITGRNLRPVSTKEIGVEKNYAIKKDITVSSNKETYFSLYLNTEVLGEGLKHESLKWELYEGSTKLNEGNFANTVQGDIITLLNNSTINSTTRNISLYIWIDGNMSNPSEMQNQDYKFVLNASATDNSESVELVEANIPKLLDGMVPITYKKCSEIEGVSEETYPECYNTTYTEINDTDKTGLIQICTMLMGETEECDVFIDELIVNGQLNLNGNTFTLQDGIDVYEANGGVMTSPVEVNFVGEKETSDIVVASSDNWYNYNEQKWANAVLVNDESLRTAQAGTIVPEENVLAYYVWIPRYKYKLFNAEKIMGTDSYNASESGIDIVFEKGTSTTGTVSCIVSSIGVETCENAVNGAYYTHPAFWWDKNNNRVREDGEELTGIWVGKFEISSSNPDDEYAEVTDVSVRIKPNVPSWRGQIVSTFFTEIQNMVILNNEYGLNNTEVDSHMMKNMEWGAVAYLTHSRYGRCTNGTCESISINNSSDYITGNGGSGVNSFGNPEITNAYDTILGVKASTTGNIYGVYDMSGGAGDYLMGNMISSDGVTMMSGNFGIYSSGYNGTFYNEGNIIKNEDGIEYPDIRYYNVYSYGNTLSDQESYLRGHLGDATGEVVVTSDFAWGNDAAIFVEAMSPWFVRGGLYDDGAASNCVAGSFSFDCDDGGWDTANSTRAVLSPLVLD